MMNTKVLFPLLLALSLVLTGPASDPDRAWAETRDEQALYRIGPADVLDIAVWNNTALSRTVPVRPDGKISLPLLNDVQAAGLTPMQLRDALAEKLVAYVPTPEVSVIVREVQSFRVSVIGEVRKPDRYDLRGRATVLDALAMAGGFAEFAARTRIVILRHNGTTVKRIPFNYNAIISANGERANFFLEPGDIILVP
jgi:polysaccharide biosynthesis/export protein